MGTSEDINGFIPWEVTMNQSLFKRTKASIIILGVALTLLGMGFFIAPAASALFLVYVCGWAFIFAGIGTIVGYFRHDPADRGAANIVLAVVEIVLGIFIMVWPGWSMMYLVILLGCVIFMTGVWDIFDAFSIRHIEGSRWGLWLVLGILTVFCGILTFITQFSMAEAIMLVGGICLIFDGVTEICLGIAL